MRRRRLVLFVMLLVIFLVTALLALTGLQQTLFHLFWSIFQIKFLIYFLLGAIAGYFTRYTQDKLSIHE